jgi:hypothetical protein
MALNPTQADIRDHWLTVAQTSSDDRLFMQHPGMEGFRSYRAPGSIVRQHRRWRTLAGNRRG